MWLVLETRLQRSIYFVCREFIQWLLCRRQLHKHLSHQHLTSPFLWSDLSEWKTALLISVNFVNVYASFLGRSINVRDGWGARLVRTSIRFSNSSCIIFEVETTGQVYTCTHTYTHLHRGNFAVMHFANAELQRRTRWNNRWTILKPYSRNKMQNKEKNQILKADCVAHGRWTTSDE